MFLVRPNGKPILKKYITQLPNSTQQIQKSQSQEGGKLKKKNLNKLTNLKITTVSTQPQPKQKLTKFINLQL